ncbi:alpha/beta hydrolase family protein [Ilumatobacter sp.]|uniref:alpha/beta hydrolase family protein n=1 Tax=Ilumatobacter sp. TaxID=1967498 RepID=UPI003B518D4C
MGRAITVRYGDHLRQVVSLRAPSGRGPHPTVVVVHGGFWRWPWGSWSTVLLGRDVRARGWASATIRYRLLGPGGRGRGAWVHRSLGLLGRDPGPGGWPQTFHDVRDAIAAVGGRVDVVDASRIVLVGHSAGGHLALWAAGGDPTRRADRGEGDADDRDAGRPGDRDRSRPVEPIGVVSLGGVCDLAPGWTRGDEAVVRLIADAPPDRRLELTSPLHRLPLGTPVVCVHGSLDETVSPTQSRRFVEAAVGAGDDARLVEIADEGHRDGLRPGSRSWTEAALAISEWFGTSGTAQDGGSPAR